MSEFKSLAVSFILSSAFTYATNCGRGILEDNFDKVWTSNDPSLNRTFYTPMNRDVRRVSRMQKIIQKLLRRTKDAELSYDPKWAQANS